jgi:hypothetical protein
MDNSLMNSPIKLLIFSLWIILFSVSYHFTNNLINDIYEINEIYENENISNNDKYYNMMNSERTKKIIKSMNTDVCNYNDDNWYKNTIKMDGEWILKVNKNYINLSSQDYFINERHNGFTCYSHPFYYIRCIDEWDNGYLDGENIRICNTNYVSIRTYIPELTIQTLFSRYLYYKNQ